HLLEPLPPLIRPHSFPSSRLPTVSDQKVAWYKLTLHANNIADLETWIGQFIKGTIVVTDGDGHPYVSAHNELLERLRASFDSSRDGVQAIPLDAPSVSLPGQVYLRSTITLPPPDWPDFFTDLVFASNLVIGRMEQVHDHLARQREHWLHTLLQEKLFP